MKMLFKFLMSNFHQSFPLYLCILYPVLRSPYSEDMKTFTCIIQSRGITSYVVVVFQSLSLVRLFATLWTAAHQASLSFTVSWSLLKFMSLELVMPSSHHILCWPLFLLPSIFLSIRVFSESALPIGWPKYGRSFSISPSNEYSGLISLLSKRLSRVFSSTTVWRYQFFSTQPFLLFSSHIHTWPLEKS